MYLSEEAQNHIENIRDRNNGGIETYKAAISDAMEIITNMHEMYASPKEQEMLIDALGVLAGYNRLLTAISKEK